MPHHKTLVTFNYSVTPPSLVSRIRKLAYLTYERTTTSMGQDLFKKERAYVWFFRKRAKYLKMYSKIDKIWKYFEKGQSHVCDYRMHETARICPVGIRMILAMGTLKRTHVLMYSVFPYNLKNLKNFSGSYNFIPFKNILLYRDRFFILFTFVFKKPYFPIFHTNYLMNNSSCRSALANLGCQ